MKKIIKLLFALTIAIISLGSLNAQDEKKDQGITLKEFETKLNNEGSKAQIIDARSFEEYQLNHLKGSINLNASDDAELKKQVAQLKKDKPVFVYSIGNGRSNTLKKKLIANGFSQVYELPGGFSNWIGSGKEVVSTTGSGLTLDQYNKLVHSDNVVLVDIGSKYCGGCKKMIPVIDSLSLNHPKDLKVVKIEFFENKQLGVDLKINSLPTVLLYKDDKIVWQKSGITSKEVIEKEINSIQKRSVSLTNSAGH